MNSNCRRHMSLRCGVWLYEQFIRKPAGVRTAGMTVQMGTMKGIWVPHTAKRDL